ncbi:MAG: oxygen-independent coproporphyrinogen III oxidase [Pseudomonadota bacterium]
MALNANRPLALDDYFDQRILQKYNTSGPRYTSYPTAIAFSENYETTEVDVAYDMLKSSDVANALSIYIHIPFCHRLCYYCGCNKIVTRHHHKADLYLDYLHKEFLLKSSKLAGCKVKDVHLGGGTPNFLSIAQMHRLMEIMNAYVTFADNPEFSIELDPRTVTLDYLTRLRDVGFTRVSFGIQDANKKVQTAINRVQDSTHIKKLIEHAKHLNFDSINLDLIYGLPHQNTATFDETLQLVKAISPDRVSLFSYAHMPQMFASQKKIKDDWLPSTTEKFALFRQAIAFMTTLGYEFIGMDHFAKSDDKLSVAHRSKTLYRNFQGYTTGIANACLGFGCSSISSVGNLYQQNAKTLNDYYAMLDSNAVPVTKGVVLTKDDIIRRDLIHTLMCNFELDKRDFSEKHNIEFDDYFCRELATLKGMQRDKLLTDNAEKIVVHDRGRLIVRNICMSFDKYLAQPMHQMRYSRVI